MCGRASQYSDLDAIERRFRLPPGTPRPNLPPAKWNAAPRQELAIVRRDASLGRVVDVARWGLVPPWAKDLSIGDRAINARDLGEDGRDLDSRPMFRDAWKSGRRCLVPLNSFFEWRKVGKAKQPVAIGLADGELLGVAGLWESWRGPDANIRSFTIITTAANELLAPIHNRMPVIIGDQDYDRWLDGSAEDARGLLRPYPPERMRYWDVTPRVNRVGEIEGPECVEPVAGARLL